MSPTPTVRLGSFDFKDSPADGLLRQGKYEEFCNGVKPKDGLDDCLFKEALRDVIRIYKTTPNLPYPSARKLFKLIQACTAKNLRLFHNVMNAIKKSLEEIVLSWMDENAEDVASFFGDLKLAVPRLVNHLASTVVKRLAFRMGDLIPEPAGPRVKDEKVFERVKVLSYHMESISEEFVTDTSVDEFLEVSGAYFKHLHKLECYSASQPGQGYQVIWCGARKLAWLKWLYHMKCAGQVQSRVDAAIVSASLSEVLVLSEWQLYHVCVETKNFREASAALCRIWLETPVATEKVCREFVRLKFAFGMQHAHQKALFEIVREHVQCMKLYSTKEYEDLMARIALDNWKDLIQTEINVYQNHRQVFFNVIDRLVGALRTPLRI